VNCKHQRAAGHTPTHTPARPTNKHYIYTYTPGSPGAAICYRALFLSSFFVRTLGALHSAAEPLGWVGADVNGRAFSQALLDHGVSWFAQ
jgi:hypothetical protein